MATKEPQDEDTDIVKLEDSNSSTTKGKNAGDKSSDTQSPHRLKPVRVYGHPNVTSGDSKSVVEVGNTKMEDTRKTNTAGNETKTCYFFKDHDHSFPGIKVAINPRRYKKFDTLLQELSKKIPGLGFGVRTVATPDGKDRISNLDGLTHDGNYICTSSRLIVRGLDISRVAPREVWRLARPPSGRRIYNNMLREDFNYTESKVLKRTVKQRSNQMYRAYVRNEPKKVTVLKNSDPTQKHLLLLNRRTGQQFEQVLSDLSGMFGFRIEKLYTTEGRKILGLNQLFKAPDTLVCCGDERFDPMGGRSTSRVMSRVSLHTRGSDVVSRKMRSRRERMANTKGRWKVWITTNGNKAASTQAQVTITVYGHKGNSGPISLGTGDGSQFQSGNIDEFEEINIGNVGEIYKIRIAHDNSGDSPGWLCDEIRMKDLDTDEELQFVCHRWLARDEDDGEICRELPAVRKYEPSLSLVRYSVYVTTGSLWNAGTDANVYMTMYGDKGDTGVRQLYSSNKSSLFKQGKTDMFTVEAVALGHLKRIIVGHDGTGPGLGWHLERIVVKEPGHKEHEANVFYCGKWLDEGEDDGKIVRELKLQDEYMDDILEKRNWEHERWKFDKDCQVKLFSLASGKAVRGKANGSLDAQGRDMDMSALFNVGVKKTMVRLFGSVTNPNSYITIDSGKMSMNGKGGPFCEFRVRVQGDRSVMLESVKNPLQFLTFGEGGQPENVKGILDKEKTRRFFVFCKGMFRHRGVVMFSSSLTQTITINPDMTMTALGKKAKMAHFRVHKVGNGVRMFESIAHPGKYIRLKDGKIDCLGERNEFSQFLVEKRKSGGYVSLQSAKQRGLYLGMKPDGRVWPTVDTGVNNIHLFPEVIEWGAPKMTEDDVIEEVDEEPLEAEQTTTQAKAPSPEPEQSHADVRPVVLVSDPIPEEEEEEEGAFKDGDWNITMTTGKGDSMATSNMVFLYAYGSKDSIGPLKLGSGKDGNFLSGKEDKVKVSIGRSVGELYKVRIGHNEAYPDSGWFLEKLNLQDCVTGDAFSIDVDRWLSRSQDDGDIWREFAVPQGGKPALPVVTYTLTVNTGSESGANTSASVFICLHGNKGDTGKRKLFKSKDTNNPFQVGAHDTFELEAVSLEGIERITIGHDGKGSDPGWYLDSVNITDSHTGQELYFHCDRWLDEKKGDHKCEVDLYPGEEPSESRGEYSIVLKTAEDSSPSCGGRVNMCVYGSKGKSEDITLYAPDPTADLFEPGNIDSFVITVGDLGDLYKVRITREDRDDWEAWHLMEVKMQDIDSKKEHMFACDCWLSRSREDFDIVRELPIALPSKQPPPVNKYEVSVKTGHHWAAETDAVLFINIIGDKGDSGRHRLYHAIDTKGDKFQRGQTDTFVFEAVSLGELTEVQVGHDSTGHGAGIYIDTVTVVEKNGLVSSDKFIFPCNAWLDKREGDGKTWRILPLMDKIDTKKPLPQRDLKKKTKGQYSVLVKTSDVPDAGTQAQVYITAFGNKGKSKQMSLGSGEQGQVLFDRATETEVSVNFGNIGEIMKIRLEHDNTNSSPSWHVDWVKLTDIDTNEELVFYINEWFAIDEGDGQIMREFSVDKPGDMPLPLTQYVVMVTTSKDSDPMASHGLVSLNLIGQFGDTGMRPLNQSILGDSSPWKPGSEDVFIIEAVSVGKVETIQLQYEGQDTVWCVEKVHVYERLAAISQTVFNCYKAFGTKDQGPVVMEEFKYSAIKPGMCPTKVVEKYYGDIAPVSSKGSYSVSVHCGNQSQSGTEDDVYMVIHGVRDQSEPIHINKTDKFHRGAVIHHNIETKGLGAIVKLRIFFGGEFTGSGWFLKKVKVKDNDTKEELQFIYNDLLTCTEDNPDGSVELPAVRPDIAPLQEDEYTFYIATGNRPEAATESDVFCELIGDWGSSGQRLLTQSKNKVPFKRGQVDEFRFKGLDLGNLKECVISLNDRGRGRGWFCDRVLVKSNLDPSLKIFQCNHWMDTGCEDRQLVRRLHKFGIMPVTPPPTGKSKGRWSCEVVTADKEDLPKLAHDRPPKSREVSLIVYGSNSVKGPIELINTDGMETFLPGHTDNFPIFGKRGQSLDLGDIGAIQKIRVCAGYEQDPNTVWTIHRVILTDDDTGEMLTYDFSQWLGEVAGDIRKELPTIKMGQGYKQVIPYYVEVHTSDEEMDSDTYSNIFITLYGLIADTGRRHLVESRSNKIKFQTGKVDVFIIDAVDLGDLEKVVIAKGPGNPWLLDKVVVKPGEFASEQYVFQHNKWIGTKDQQHIELEETLRLTTVQTSFVATNETKQLPESKGSWKITTETGGLKGGDNPDIVVVFCSEQEESELCPLKSNRDNAFQIGQTDISTVRTASDVGELYKIRLGFMDNSHYKGWLLRKITCEDEDTGDIFHYEINDWILVDEKNDGWKEIPVAWPAIKVPAVMKYQVIVYTGDVHSAGTDANVYVALFGTKGSTGRRLLKHSLTNNSKFEQDQVDQFEVEAVDLGKVTKVVIGHDSSGSGSGWFLKKVVITESPESIQKFVFPCDKWLDEGEDDNKIERTLILDESVSDLSAPELQTQASKLPTPTVETGIKTPIPEPKAKTPEPKAKTPTPEPKAKTLSPEPKTKTPTPEPKAKTPTPEPKVKTPSPEPKAKTPSPEPKAKTPTPEPDVKAPTPEAVVEAPSQERESVVQSQEQNEESGKELDTARTDSPKDKTPLPPSPKDGDYKVYVIASNQEDGRGSEAQLVLTVYGDLGNSGPISLGEPNKGFFKAGFTDLFDIHVDKEELGEIRKIRLEVENTHPNASVMLDKVEMEDKVKEQKFIFNVNIPLSLEEGDLAIEIPVDDRTHEVWPVRRYEVQTYTSTDPDAGTDALAHIVLVGTLGDSGRRYLVKNRDGGKKFQPGAVDSFIVEAVDLGRLETIIIGHNGKGAESGWSLDKVAIKESVDAKEKYLFPCGSRLQDDDDYGIVEVELYMDRVEREKSDVENTNNNAQDENADNEDTNTEEQLTERSKEEQDKIDDRDDDKGDDNQQTVKEDDKDDTKTDRVDDDKQSVKGEDLVVNGNSVKGETYRKDGQQPNTEEAKTEDKTENEG